MLYQMINKSAGNVLLEIVQQTTEALTSTIKLPVPDGIFLERNSSLKALKDLHTLIQSLKLTNKNTRKSLCLDEISKHSKLALIAVAL